MAERAIDNREVVGSTPTPWTNLQAGAAKRKGTRLPTWHCVGSNPTARSIFFLGALHLRDIADRVCALGRFVRRGLANSRDHVERILNVNIFWNDLGRESFAGLALHHKR